MSFKEYDQEQQFLLPSLCVTSYLRDIEPK